VLTSWGATRSTKLPHTTVEQLYICAVKHIICLMTKIIFLSCFEKKNSFVNEYVHKNSLRHQKYGENRPRERHVQARMNFYSRGSYICCVIWVNAAITYLHVILLTMYESRENWRRKYRSYVLKAHESALKRVPRICTVS